MLHAGLDGSMSGGMETSMPTPPTPPSIMHQLPPLAKNSRRVILVQHGQTDYNSRGMMHGAAQEHDVQLNFAGKVEAAMITSALQGLPLGVIASSHLARSEETADIIAQGLLTTATEDNNSHSIVRIVNHRLGEMRLGEYEGMVLTGPESTFESRSKFESLNSIMNANTQVPWPGGGESIAALKARAMAGVEQVLRGFPDVDHVCIVAHVQWSKVLLMQLLADNEKVAAATTPQSFEQGNACINVLDVDAKGRWKLEMMNHLQHLETAFA
jgi:probable phosphoglycerate mutase